MSFNSSKSRGGGGEVAKEKMASGGGAGMGKGYVQFGDKREGKYKYLGKWFSGIKIKTHVENAIKKAKRN